MRSDASSTTASKVIATAMDTELGLETRPDGQSRDVKSLRVLPRTMVTRRQFRLSRLYGCAVRPCRRESVRLFGLEAVWLFGLEALWLFGCLAVRLSGCLAVRLFGCSAVRLFGCLARPLGR